MLLQDLWTFITIKSYFFKWCKKIHDFRCVQRYLFKFLNRFDSKHNFEHLHRFSSVRILIFGIRFFFAVFLSLRRNKSSDSDKDLPDPDLSLKIKSGSEKTQFRLDKKKVCFSSLSPQWRKSKAVLRNSFITILINRVELLLRNN